jgi:hypothetical protein
LTWRPGNGQGRARDEREGAKRGGAELGHEFQVLSHPRSHSCKLKEIKRTDMFDTTFFLQKRRKRSEEYPDSRLPLAVKVYHGKSTTRAGKKAESLFPAKTQRHEKKQK